MGLTPSPLEPSLLANWILCKKKDFVIIDVRDEDYLDLKISGSIHIPFSPLISNYILNDDEDPPSGLTVEDTFQTLLETHFPARSQFIFHCHYCIERGPTAAKLFMHYLEKYKQGKNIQVYYLKDGFAGWLNMYYNGDKTDDALYIERF